MIYSTILFHWKFYILHLTAKSQAGWKFKKAAIIKIQKYGY
jgi:hypothetical protein